jgi:adenylate cyclase
VLLYSLLIIHFDGISYKYLPRQLEEYGMNPADLQHITSIIQAKSQLSIALSSLEQNARQIQRDCLSQDPDIIEPLHAVLKGLQDMLNLNHRLPHNEREAQILQEELDDGGWAKFERKFIHDIRNPLGVVLGYSEILDETLEDFILELGNQNVQWMHDARELLSAFSEQLHYLNQSLNQIFPVRSKDVNRPTTLIPMSDSPRLDRTPFPTSVLTPLSTNHDTNTTSNKFKQIQTPTTSLGFRATADTVLSVNKSSLVLVVDDNSSNRDLLCSMLKREGYQGQGAASAKEALELLKQEEYDLILLDLIMPEMNGYELLEHLKASLQWRRIPVLMISGDNELESAIRCIEMGAEDFLQKPFNRVLLNARIGACIDKKQLMDEMEQQNQRFKSLLYRILPAPVVKRLDEGEVMIADRFNSTSIIFSDLVGFTQFSSNMTPSQLISLLNEIFSVFDEVADRFGVEKIKTIGDAYMAAAGLPIARDDHADAALQMGIEMIKELEKIRLSHQIPLQMRVGIHSGPVAAGIIGQNRFLYDVWGDTVNIASRLEANGTASAVHVSQATFDLLKKPYTLQSTGGVALKGKGLVQSYLCYPFPV